jgi:hypothetical protein
MENSARNQNLKTGSKENSMLESESSEYYFAFRIELQNDDDMSAENVKHWCKEAGQFFRKVYDEIFFFETVDLEDDERVLATCQKRKSDEVSVDEDNAKRSKLSVMSENVAMDDSSDVQMDDRSDTQDAISDGTNPAEPVKPSAVTEQAPEEYPVLQVYSTIKERLWNMRNKWKQRALSYLNKNPRNLTPKDAFDLETTISEMIRSQEMVNQRTLKSPVQVSTIVKASLGGASVGGGAKAGASEATIHVWFFPKPAPNHKDFRNFYEFFMPFFARIVQECFGKV